MNKEIGWKASFIADMPGRVTIDSYNSEFALFGWSVDDIFVFHHQRHRATRRRMEGPSVE